MPGRGNAVASRLTVTVEDDTGTTQTVQIRSAGNVRIQ